MFIDTPLQLPEPSPQEQQQTAILHQLIEQEIHENNGSIPFARFMELCLYQPGLGYYVTRQKIFGEGGDFITAPEMSPLFSQCLARQCQQVLEHCDKKNILEFGGGSGINAVQILQYLESVEALPDQYLILDISPNLRAEQRDLLQSRIPHLAERVRWIESLQGNDFEGIIIANEVLDAMPVHRIRVKDNSEIVELGVGIEGDHFCWVEQTPSNDELKALAQAIPEQLDYALDVPYETEINLAGLGWIRSLADFMKKGAVILADYGYPRSEFFSAERREGTVMCHYKHRAHGHPLIFPGIQDLTSHVEFTSIAETALEAGFHVAGFSSQALFLTGCGMEQLLQQMDTSDTKSFITQIQSIKKLILPQEMGELFKVIGLTKDFDLQLIGFSAQDQRYRL